MFRYLESLVLEFCYWFVHSKFAISNTICGCLRLIKDIIVSYSMAPRTPMLVVTVGRPKFLLTYFTTSLLSPP